jgi:hypothetical protein
VNKDRVDAVHGLADQGRARRYRREEAILRELARRADIVYPDLEVFLDLPHPELD